MVTLYILVPAPGCLKYKTEFPLVPFKSQNIFGGSAIVDPNVTRYKHARISGKGIGAAPCGRDSNFQGKPGTTLLIDSCAHPTQSSTFPKWPRYSISPIGKLKGGFADRESSPSHWRKALSPYQQRWTKPVVGQKLRSPLVAPRIATMTTPI